MSVTMETRADVAAYLAAVFARARGLAEFRVFDPDAGPDAPPSARLFVPPDDVDAILAFLERHQHAHCYIGMATRRDATRGTAENCWTLGTLFVDIDFKKTEEAKARAWLVSLPCPPSLIIRSGYGLHVYWLLREPLPLPEHEEGARTLLRDLATAAGGDRAAAEVARVLRPPRTWNHKYDPPRRVELECCDPSRRYTLADFDWLPPEPGGARTDGTAPARDWAGLLQGAGDGDRHGVATQLVGHYLGRGIAPAEVEEILLGFAARCRPPITGERIAEFRRIVRNLAAKDARKPAGGDERGRGTVEVVEPALPAPPEAGALVVPDHAMIGLGRDFADLYHRYLEPPVSFYFFAFLTYFGALVAKKITLASQLQPAPRLFTVLIGESADTRKSRALLDTDRFFRDLGPEHSPRVLFGTGSAEGIAAELQDQSVLLLHIDELKTLVDKARQDGSVLLPMVSTLFERTDYDNRVKKDRVSVRDGHLILVAACTRETYATMFDARFHSIGFINRLWLVADRAAPRFSTPGMIPLVELEALRQAVRARLDALHAAWVRQQCRPVAYPLTPEAHRIFDAWYAARAGTVFEKRLETYGHRLMLGLVATTGRDAVDATIAAAVVGLLRYQLDARRECDPIDAENTIAAVEERIRRALARGALKGRELQRRCHSARVGLWMWTTAIDNLRRAGEVARDPRLDLFWATPDATVTSSVTSTKVGDFVNDSAEYAKSNTPRGGLETHDP